MSTERTDQIQIDIGGESPYQIDITRQNVEMRGLPHALHGATFAQVSDIHGGFAGLEKVYEAAISQVNANRPDYIFFTGDYIDRRSSHDNYPMVEFLESFRAERGVFGCLGNHDHRRGIAGTRRILEKAGVHLLENESIRLDSGLWLAGVDDLHEGQPDVARTLADLPGDQTSIVLSHNPNMINHARGRDVLILSGHTHGAQFRLKFPPPVVICFLHLRCLQVAGWYRRGNARLYVNRGLGVTGKPFRIDCPAEISFFTMVPHPEDHPAPVQSSEGAEAARELAART